MTVWIMSLFLMLELAEQEEFAHLTTVGGYHQVGVLQIALLLLFLLSQDVTVISVVTLNLTRSGKLETLFGTGIRLYFWHFFVS